jgi:hypothetical protein
MPGYVPPIPADASGAPEVNYWQGDTQEPTLAERIDGHEPYPASPPAYDVENYARNVQYQANLRVLAGALYAERGAIVVTIAGVTVGNQRRLTVNGTAVNYSDTGTDTLASVTQAFADLINGNVTITSGASAAGAVVLAAGSLGVYAAQPGSNSLTVVAAVLAGAGTIVASAVTTPSIVVPASLLAAVEAYVLGTSPDDDGPDNDVRLVLDRLTGAFRAGSVSATQWDTRAAGTIGIGIQAVPVADDAIAIGTGSDATAVADLAIGKNSAANSGGGGNDHATAIGTATATGEAALAVGFGAAATAAGATALGVAATASAANANAIGDVDATAAGATAAGYKTVASGAGALATGQQSDSLGPVVTASGAGSRAHARTTNSFATAAGATTASGVGSDAFGQGSKAVGDYSLARGLGAETTDQSEVAEGGIGIDGNLSVDSGKHQAGRVVVQSRTVGAQTRYLSPSDLDASAANSPAWTPHDDRGWIVRVRVVAKDIAAGNVETWTCEGAASKDAGTLAISAGLSGAMTVGDTLGTAVPLTPPSISANTGSLVIEVVGATNDYRWTGQIEYVQAGINY